MTATYATPLELARFLNIEQTVPAKVPGATKTNELVGAGDGSTLSFDLDYSFIIAGSYTIYYGANADSITALTEVTHYTLDKDLGRITLTTAGRTLVSTNNIYAKYSYTQSGNGVEGISNTQLQEVLDRAQAEIDKATSTHFATGTDATPDYNQVTNEKHSGRGRYLRSYYLKEYPLPDVSTTLDGDVAIDDDTITVASTNGFPSSGTIGIETDKITYTGKTSTTFTGCSGVESAHTSETEVYPFVFEYSATGEGSAPTWVVLNPANEFDLDFTSGRLYLSNDSINDCYFPTRYPPSGIPNRFRAT
jgi:hypothetical protein